MGDITGQFVSVWSGNTLVGSGHIHSQNPDLFIVQERVRGRSGKRWRQAFMHYRVKPLEPIGAGLWAAEIW